MMTATPDSLSMARINLTPIEPALDATHLDQLIELWLDHVRATCSEPTAINYAYKVVFFRDWWAEIGPSRDWQLRERDLLAYKRYLEDEARSVWDRPLSYHTRHDALRRLRQMFAWAQSKGYITSVDCRSWVPYADGAVPERQAVPMSALERLFAETDTSMYPERDQAILAVLIGTGVRRGECASIQVQDIRFDPIGSGVFRVQGKRTRRNRKGIRNVAFDAATGGFLRAYLDATGHREGPLFRTERGEGLSPQGIYRVVKRCVWAAGLDDVVQGCHDLRRAFATHFIKRFRGPAHADILRRQMGHASYRTTTLYTLLEPEDYRHELVSPMTLLADRGK